MNAVISGIEKILPKRKVDVFGKNSLMFNSLPYYFLFSIMILFWLGGLQSGFAFIFIIYGVLPLLDEFFSLDQRNPTKEEYQKLQANDFYFKLALYATVAADWLLFIDSMNMISTLSLNFVTCFQLMGYIFILSNLEAVQFAIAHEIFHKNGIHRYTGTIHMVKNLYMHFTYEHLYGHHRRVATPEDPASAEKGDNVYTFFINSFLGSYKSVYKMEKEKNKPFYLNYAVLSVICSALFISLMFKVYGIQGGLLYLVIAFGSIFYLEAINYIQHYGLRRKKKADGSYEKVTIHHSWNAPHRFSNYLLFKLQRHSDHHQNSLKPYQTLVSLEDSPHLPHGYSVIIFMSFFPSTWFRIMDPLVDEYNRANTGNIQGEVMKKCVHQTRKFILGFFIYTLSFFVVSTALSA